MPDIFVDPDFNEPAPQVTIPVEKPKEPKAKKDKPSPSGNRLRALQAYCERPEGIYFKHLGPNEEILLFLRAHPITNVSWIIITLLLTIIPVPLLPLLDSIFPSFFSLPVEYKIISVAFYMLIIFSYTLVNFLQWFYNIGIVATQNIIDIDYTQIVQVHVSATVIEKIEDVSYKQSGFIQTLFNYGDVHVQTAGTTENVEFFGVPDPDKVTIFIQGLLGRLNNSLEEDV